MEAPEPSQASAPDNRALLQLVCEAAQAGASVIRRRSDEAGSLVWNEKSPLDFVTEVDRSAETAIVGVLRGSIPNARVVGEELSPNTPSGPGIGFFVDPLDGTTNFLHAYPEYSVSIAAERNGALVAAVVLNVPTGEQFTALAGKGAWRDGTPIRVSTIGDPRKALLGTGFPFKHPELIPMYLRQLGAMLESTSGVRRAGSAALDLADVACGRFDGFWELKLAPWDIAAGILLVREAGGIVTDLRGLDAELAHTPIVAGNLAIHPWLLDLLGRARAAGADSTSLGAVE